jgi:aspartate aminotransferase
LSKKLLKKAIDENYSFYTPVPGYLDLREAIVAKFKRDNSLDYTPDQIVVSTGAKQAIINAILCLVNPGDEVIIPAPYWVSYVPMVQLAEGVPVIVKTGVDQDFKITPAQLQQAITPKTKVILYSSPCNPSGSIYTEQELGALAKVVLQHDDLMVFSDEIYELISYTGRVPSMAAIPGMKDRTVVINGLSKSFAMTGWRLGYVAAPKELAAACDKMQGQFYIGYLQHCPTSCYSCSQCKSIGIGKHASSLRKTSGFSDWQIEEYERLTSECSAWCFLRFSGCVGLFWQVT